MYDSYIIYILIDECCEICILMFYVVQLFLYFDQDVINFRIFREDISIFAFTSSTAFSIQKTNSTIKRIMKLILQFPISHHCVHIKNRCPSTPHHVYFTTVKVVVLYS